MDFLIICLLILLSILFLVFPVLLLEKQQNEKILEKSQRIATYTQYIISKFQLNPFVTVQEMDFRIISSLFSFLYLSSFITGEVVTEKFWKNHSVLLRTPTISSKFQLNLFTITEVINF